MNSKKDIKPQPIKENVSIWIRLDRFYDWKIKYWKLTTEYGSWGSWLGSWGIRIDWACFNIRFHWRIPNNCWGCNFCADYGGHVTYCDLHYKVNRPFFKSHQDTIMEVSDIIDKEGCPLEFFWY